MRLNAFLLAGLFVGMGAVIVSGAEEGAPAFREPLFFSEVDRENRTPQAVRVGGVVFVSAMTGPGESAEEQVRTIYIRLQSVLGNYGLTMADVAHERVYFSSDEALRKLKAMRGRYYGGSAGPATSFVRVAGFEDPGTLVSVEMMVVASPGEE
ncbi:RidA family protein [Pelagicoccus mobilis]|uniref:RidA family protein n=1 Tax=Pelagicoccus mobilis TaxID=415221 RepID=A0A934RYY8_9BACT|nr:RidA family protein [Pelagicoccus mobilis]MBK1876414.1 RidA family protein [Pelagicoccus mobilis]